MIPPFHDVNIPFRIEIYEGLGEVHGRLRIGEGVLRIEYLMKDAVIGLLRTEARELNVALESIDEIDFHDGWFRKRLTIRAGSISSFADIPGAENGVLVLKIARKDTQRALQAVSSLRLLLAEAKLKALDGWEQRPLPDQT